MPLRLLCGKQNEDKKKYTVFYVEVDMANSWEALIEYSQATSMYVDFKKQLLEVYNQVKSHFGISYPRPTHW